MVCCGTCASGTQEHGQFVEKCCFKLLAAVRGYRRWGTEGGDPSVDEHLGHCCSGAVRYGDGFRPACEPVNTSQQIAIALGRGQWPHNIDVYVVKAGGRRCKGTTLSSGVSVDLRLLAFDASSGPLSYVRVHTWPNIARTDKFEGCPDARVGKIVEGVENTPSVALWHKRALVTCGHITPDG